MKTQRIAFIINPISGRKKKNKLHDQIMMHLDTSLFDPMFHYTDYPGHATELAANCLKEKINYLVAVGGDGTVNEVANALVSKPARLGIIPTGSGNGLARHLNIPVNLKKAVGKINNNQERKIDVGKLNDYYFFCTCGIGFDAKIGRKFAKGDTRGFRNYIKTVFREYRTYKPKKRKFKIDGTSYTRRTFLITIANASQFGNNAFIAPKASIDDGLLDICMIKPFPARHALLLGIRLFNRSIESSKYYEVIQGKHIRFKESKTHKLHIDGEPIKIKGKLGVSILPGALNIFQ